MGAIRHEMNSRKWFWAAIGYQCAFAYTAALIIYQFGMLFAGQPSVLGLVAASVVLFGLLYMVFRPARGEKESYGRERIIWEQ